MSTPVFSTENSSHIQTRRNPVKDDNAPNNRRSLSGKVRNFFRKNSSSPNRNNNNGRPPRAPSRQRSTSPEPIRTATEAPHLRAPTVGWPFCKKKNKSNEITSKTKQKTKKKTTSTIEISSPIYQQEHETSIRGQNFVPRTPELAHSGTGRTHSISSYDTPGKGFRDYTVIDNTTSPETIQINTDVITPHTYTSDRSRSPSFSRQRLPDTNIDYSYNHDTSPPASDIDIIPISKQHQHQYIGNDTSSLTTTQVLVENNPLIVPPINSNQWKSMSHSSLSNTTELRSTTTTTSSSIDMNTPKLNPPLIPLSSVSSKRSRQTNSQSHDDDEAYNSSSTVHNYNIKTTYSSTPDLDTLNNDFSRSPRSNLNQYPGLSAIVEHHIHPTSVQFNQPLPTPTSPKRPIRFDTATTTLNGYERQHQQQYWPSTKTNIISTSPSLIHHHDGYIRPLTPPKSPIQPDVSVIHVNPDDLRRQSPSRTRHYITNEPPIIYRSSTTIYTKDKHAYPESGQIKTWSIQDNDNTYKKPITTHQILSPKLTNENDYIQQNYSTNNRYSHYVNTSNFSRPVFLNERDHISDSSIRSYKPIEYIQESINTKNPVDNREGVLRHYTLKRTDYYDGLGIIISADSETRLNHRIRDLEIGSPGSRAGLHVNDRIIYVNGVNVEQMEFRDVLLLIKQGLNNNHLEFCVTSE